MLLKINAIEYEIKHHGQVRDFGIYEENSDWGGSGDELPETDEDDLISMGNLIIKEDAPTEMKVPPPELELNIQVDEEIPESDDEMPELEDCSPLIDEHKTTEPDTSLSLISNVSGDEVIQIPEADDSIMSVVHDAVPDDETDISSTSSSFVTSSEDDHAISEDISDTLSDDGMNRKNLGRKIPVKVEEERKKRKVTFRDQVKYHSKSLHLWGSKRWMWKRPCFRNHKLVVIGDSMVRGFGRVNYKIEGHAIIAYGGLELLELIQILRTGALNNSVNLKKTDERIKVMKGETVMALNTKCNLCNTNCSGKSRRDTIYRVK